jgi:hypothetical protein
VEVGYGSPAGDGVRLSCALEAADPRGKDRTPAFYEYAASMGWILPVRRNLAERNLADCSRDETY